jgi:hypothetical protein
MIGDVSHKQMCKMVTAMLLSLPNGAEWNLRHTYGTKDTQRPQMWVAVVSAMMEFAGLGRDRPLSAMITMWKYSECQPTSHRSIIEPKLTQ